MELMLPLAAKPEARSEHALTVSEAEIREYAGTYTNAPERAEIVVKQGRLVLQREDGEFPITKIGNYRFSIRKPGESEAEEFVLVRGADGKREYLHIERHALRKVQANR
jgi:hypothetical protein